MSRFFGLAWAPAAWGAALPLRVSLLATLLSFLMLVGLPAQAADSYQSGTLSNITTVSDGLLVKLDNGPPTNCGSTPYGWMLIPEANKTMIATALMMWYSGQRVGTIYTNPNTAGGFCVVSQLDPA